MFPKCDKKGSEKLTLLRKLYIFHSPLACSNQDLLSRSNSFPEKQKWYPKRAPINIYKPEFDEVLVRRYYRAGLKILQDANIVTSTFLHDPTNDLSKKILMKDTNHKEIITAIKDVSQYGSDFMFIEFESSFGSFKEVEETFQNIKESIKYGKLLLSIACTLGAKEDTSSESEANFYIEDHCLPDDM